MAVPDFQSFFRPMLEALSDGSPRSLTVMREQLRTRLAEVWPELEIVAEAKNGIEAVELTQAHRPIWCSSTSACPE